MNRFLVVLLFRSQLWFVPSHHKVVQAVQFTCPIVIFDALAIPEENQGRVARDLKSSMRSE